MNRRGMTLAELVIVLAILAVLTTIAVTMTDGVLDQAKFDATRTTLDNVRTAIVGPTNPQDATPSFVSDMGRLPTAWSELTSSIPTFTVVPMPLTTAVPDLSPANGYTGGMGTMVYLGAGSRGPYLRLPSGLAAPVDGWGTALAFPTGPITPGTATTAASGSLVFSSTGKPPTGDGGVSPFAQTQSVTITASNVFARLSVSLAANNQQSLGNGQPRTSTDMSGVITTTTMQITPVVGKTCVVLFCANGSGSTPSLTTDVESAGTSPYSYQYSSVPCGNCALFAYQLVTVTTTTQVGMAAPTTTPPTPKVLVSSIQYLRITGDTSKTIFLDLY